MKARKAAAICALSLLIGIGGCGSYSSPARTPAAVPEISISPVSVVAGSSDLVLTVTGSKFTDDAHNKSVVVWSANGSDQSLATSLVSKTQLTAVVPAALLAQPVTAKVLVERGDPAGSGPFSQSAFTYFAVTATPIPSLSISSILPSSVVAGSPDLTLTVMGSAFAHSNHNKSLVMWSANGSVNVLATTFDSGTQLTAVIPAALLTSPLTAQISVETGDPMGSGPFATSNSITFTVTSP